MSNLNFKNFRKVSTDEKATTLIHPDGHQIKIAHSKLSPQLKEGLDKLPLHAAMGGKVKGYAEAGEVTKDDSSTDSSDTTKGVTINIGQPPQAPTAAVATPQVQAPASGESQPVDNTPLDIQPVAANDPNVQQTATQAPPVQSAQGQQPTPQAGPTNQILSDQPDSQDPTTAVSDNLRSEDQAWQNDLQNGHVTPETYQSLFAKKDTLGKIGTIFGLMISGAGSGLSKQPNALLQMMNSQISNDLDAQKQSKQNAQNFIRLHQQNLLNQAQVGNLVRQGVLTEEQAKNMKVEADTKSVALSNMLMNRSALHDLTTRVQAMPQGSPERQQGENMLASLYGAVNNENYALADRAQAASALLNNQTGSAAQAASKNVDYGKMNQLERSSQLKFPGTPSSEDLSAATKEAATLEESRSIRSDYVDSFNKLQNMTLAGKLSPNQRAAYVNPLAAKLAKQSAGRYNLQEAKSIVDGMFPATTDIGKGTSDVKLKKGLDYFNTIDAGTPTLNRFGLKNPPAQNTEQSSGGIRVMSPSGIAGTLPSSKLQEALKKGFKRI